VDDRTVFRNRVDAGRRLGEHLAQRDWGEVVVLGLPRGGVPVAAEVAYALGAPLDVVVVRKLGVPDHPELAMGAIAEGEDRLVDPRIVRAAGVTDDQVDEVEAAEQRTLMERVQRLRRGRPPLSLAGRTAIIVDDGVATAATARAACSSARSRGAPRVVVAAPVCSPDARVRLEVPGGADEVVCLSAPVGFRAVGMHYQDFEPTTDAEVERLLDTGVTREGHGTPAPGTAADPDADAVAEIRAAARPLADPADLEPVVQAARERRVVCIGEASHGTHEFYVWRAELTRRLIEDDGLRFVAVEGDWPDCWRVDQWVRGQGDPDLRAVDVLRSFERWPTWMWANEETADFLTWLRDHNESLAPEERVGFYGLDVYSLWDSLWEVMHWLEQHDPEALPTAMRAWECFSPYGGDPQHYAWMTRVVPDSCEEEVVAMLATVEDRARRRTGDGSVLNAVQNARVAAGAEEYYRAMMRGDRQSWNVRDRHMVETLDLLLSPDGESARPTRGVVWAHNTHVGDATATDMASVGMVNLGQLARERYGRDHVLLVGLGCHRGSVVAASAWGEPEHYYEVPVARPRSHEALLHDALGSPAVLVTPTEVRTGTGVERPSWWTDRRGHRAIGVVYNPLRESGNYVPTVIGRRYDAFLWFEHAEGLRPLRALVHSAPGAEAGSRRPER